MAERSMGIPAWVRGLALACLLCVAAAVAAGCANVRVVTVTAVPPDAMITIDGVARGRGPVEEGLSFGRGRTHTVKVSRLGFAEQTITLDSSAEDAEVKVVLKPRSKRIRVAVGPLPAIVKVDGKPVGGGAVTEAATDLEFAVDAKDEWVPHVVTAERPGYRRAERRVRFTDPSDLYTLSIEPERKDVTLATDPPGGDVTVDGKPAGKAPVTLRDLVIGTDPQTNEWIGHKVRATKPGYEPAEAVVSWDDGRTEYPLKLGVKTKTVRVKTVPADAVVKLGETVLPRDPDGSARAAVDFPPTNDVGDLPVRELTVSPSPAAPGFEPAKLTVAWDDGKADYAVTLTPAPVRQVPMVRARWVNELGRWRLAGDTVQVSTTPKTDERPGVRVTRLIGLAAPADGMIDSLATSPDGSLLAYSVVSVTGAGGVRSQVLVRPLEAAALGRPPVRLTDGDAVDLMPSFSPDGRTVLFARTRDGGRTAAVYRAAPDAKDKAEPLTPPGGAVDLWPTLDSAPQPRLYAQAMPANGSAPGLVAMELGPDGKKPARRVDLKEAGEQPRVSPLADAVAFTRRDPKTGNRDVWVLREGSEEAENLTKSPDDDDFDPAWSKDGGRIAFTSDRQTPAPATRPTSGPAEAKRDQNIWVWDAATPDRPQRVTWNTSRDDSPAWNGDGTVIYFRSNRGGEWAVWAVDLK